MAKFITVIQGHPDPKPERFCRAIGEAYARGARAGGHRVKQIDVASLDFPLIRSQAEYENTPPPPDIEKAQDAIKSADHVVIIYPLWMGSLPALLKGFFEQLLRPGFGYEPNPKGFMGKLLKGKSARIIVTMGMPALVYRWYFRAHGLKSLERGGLALCGFAPIRDTLFGLVQSASDKKRESWLAKVEKLGEKAV